MFAAAAAWPGCGRSPSTSEARVRSVPSSASRLIAAVRSAVCRSRARSAHASISMATMPSVPLMRARPSFSTSSTGSRPASASAVAAGSRPLSVRTSPSPITASATWASGARSPEQPYSRTTGVIPAFSRSAYAWALRGRTPVRPVARVRSRSNAVPRTTSASTSSPELAACDRIRLRCNWLRCDVGCAWSPARESDRDTVHRHVAGRERLDICAGRPPPLQAGLVEAGARAVPRDPLELVLGEAMAAQHDVGGGLVHPVSHRTRAALPTTSRRTARRGRLAVLPGQAG